MVGRLHHDCVVNIRRRDEIPESLYRTMLKRRKEVFVDELKWNLPEYDGSDFEEDQFDADDTLYVDVNVGPTLAYSARVLPLERSMVAALWPDMLAELPVGAWEISRFVRHATVPKEDARVSIKLFAAWMAVEGYDPFFAVADRAVLIYYGRVLNFMPDRVTAYEQYGGINLVQWLR